jgi:nucleoid-associated protein YgaU
VVFVVALVLSVGSVAQRGLADRGGEPASVSTVGRPTNGLDGASGAGYVATYVVRPGDTLWAIAERVYPSADVAAIVDALVSLNGGAAIQAGQTLNLP